MEASKAAKELKIRDRGDFFQDAEPSSFCDAIMDGAFNKVMQVCNLRVLFASVGPESVDYSCARCKQ